MTTIEKIKNLYNLSGNIHHGFDEDELAASEATLNITFPSVLREYYLTLGKNEDINYSFNRLLQPKNEIGFSDDRYLIFYEENQTVVYWGIKEADLHLDNPPVYGNYSPGDPEGEWFMDSSTTEDFLLTMATWNGTLGGLKYNANSLDAPAADIVQYIENNWKELKNITFQHQRIFTNDFREIISVTTDENHQPTGIFIGTSHQQRFSHLMNVLNVDWSYTSDEDEDEDEAD